MSHLKYQHEAIMLHRVTVTNTAGGRTLTSLLNTIGVTIDPNVIYIEVQNVGQGNIYVTVDPVVPSVNSFVILPTGGLGFRLGLNSIDRVRFWTNGADVDMNVVGQGDE